MIVRVAVKPVCNTTGVERTDREISISEPFSCAVDVTQLETHDYVL